MRRIAKAPIPAILAEKSNKWTADLIAEPNSDYRKFKYRHPDIKAALVAETSSKCVYCESKIGHNTPGDVEHKTPSSVDGSVHFSWPNLTIACTECNRRKNNYFDQAKPFLDPNVDDVETRVVHHGPIVNWMPGDAAAEVTVKTLELHDITRRELLSRKVETIDKLNNMVARLSEADPLVQAMMLVAIAKMQAIESEYSAMVRSICSTYGI